MKKRLSLVLALCLLCLSSLALADTPHVTDEADLFTSAEEAELEALILQFQEKTNMDFAVLTTEDDRGSLQATADAFYEQGGYGLDEYRSGAAYYIDMYQRTPYLSTTGVMIDYLTDERIEAAHESSYDRLVQGDYAGAVEQMIYAVYGYVQAGIPEGQYRYDVVTGQRLTAFHKSLTPSEVLVCGLIALVLALLFIKNVQGRYALKGSTYSYDRAANAACTLTGQTDDYLRTTTVRAPKAPPPQPGGGGSSHRSGGSGVHTSSGGMTHGGGAGRKF